MVEDVGTSPPRGRFLVWVLVGAIGADTQIEGFNDNLLFETVGLNQFDGVGHLGIAFVIQEIRYGGPASDAPVSIGSRGTWDGVEHDSRTGRC